MVTRMMLGMAACLGSVMAADTLDVSGRVLDKLESPIPSPRICLLEDKSLCVSGDADGRFRFVHALASPVRKVLRSRRGVEFRGGRFRLHSGAALTAQVEWFDMRGGVLDRRAVDLVAGENDLGPAPAGRGLMLVRVRAGEDVFLGKAVGHFGVPQAGPVVAPGPFAKAAHHEQRTLVFSAPGYRTRYEPMIVLNTFTDMEIHLAAEDDSGFHLDQDFTGKVLSLDRGKGKILIEYASVQCAGGSRLASTYVDTLNYIWRDGEMLLWGESDCQGTRLTGAGPDIVGTWNRESFPVHLPQDLLPANCRTGIQMRFPVASRLRIGEKEIGTEITYDFCPQERYGWQIEEMFGSQAGIVKTGNTCRETAYRNEQGESASVSYTAAGATISAEFRFKEAVCRYWESPYALEPEACPDPLSARFEDFRRCVMNSGFSSH